MIGKVFEKLMGGSKHERDVKRMWPIVHQVNEIYATLTALSDDELRAKTETYKTEIAEAVKGVQAQITDLKAQLKATESEESLDYETVRQQVDALEKEEHEITEGVLQRLMPEAFAVVKETCRRLVGKKWKVAGQEITWDMVPFDVQIIGGIVLHEGRIAEMATGEGKTLVASFPLYLNALVDKGVHLVTVNDYLARRDAEWMSEIFRFHGITVAYITNDMTPAQRKVAYAADITYGTNNEFGFDYLRDNMAIQKENLVQRGHHFAIIDEVDSVLIDEARTPLIISGPVGESRNKFAEMKPLVEKLIRAQTVLVNRMVGDGDRMLKSGEEYDAGIKLLQAFRGGPKNPRLAKLMREPGVQKLIRRVESDFMRDKKLHELDEDLFYSIEEKANTIDMTEKGRQHIAPGNVDMFVLPDLATQLSEIEGDEEMAADDRLKKKEVLQLEYADKSEKLHNISQLLRAYSLFEKDVEYVVSEDGKVMIVDEFTGRLMPGRRFSDGLHQALEAKENVRIERETQTLATITLQNLFRLYSKLAGMTGTAETEEGEFWEIYKLDVVVIPTNEPIRRDDQDDVIYKTKREKYNAIIDEIEHFHQEGLPVLVGTITVDVSETLSRMLKRRGIKHSVLNAKQHQSEAAIVTTAGQPGMVTIATNMAGRGTDIKLGAGVIRIEKERAQELVKAVAKAASGSETILIHEIYLDDVQELVRMLEEAGMQPRIAASREDALALLHGDTLPGGVHVIPKTYGGLTDAKVERSGLLHFKARDYSYGGLHILGTERHESRRIDRQLRGRAGRQGDPGSSSFFLSLEDDLMRLFAPDRIIGVMDRLGVEEGEVISHPMVTKSIERAQKRVENRNFEIRKHLLEYDDVMNKQREVVYNRRRRALEGENLHDEILELIAITVEDIVHAHTDGDHADVWDIEGMAERLIKSMLLPLPFDPGKSGQMNRNELIDTVMDAAQAAYNRKRQMLGDDLMAQLERFATLKTIDERWKEHLYEMDQLKEGIGLRAYGQKDPLLEYKQEGFRTFTEMLGRIDEEILEICFKAQIQTEAPETWTPRRRQEPMEMAAVHQDTHGMGFAGQGGAGGSAGPQAAGKKQPVKVEARTGRNDPCPCGSGKKFKHCHGRGE